jgi:SAM-dependent methyltransferase
MNVLQLLTLNPDRAHIPSDLLPPAQDHPREPAYTKLSDVKLEHPLDYYVARDTSPIPTTPQRELYHGDRHFDYWLSGLADTLRVTQSIAKYGTPLAPGDRFLDIGCASGRVIRHFAAQFPELESWGCDINRAHIEWMSQHLPPSLKVFQSAAYPHLPLPDNFFAGISAFSVFTHLEELELAWLLELRRILRPGGIAYITVHTENTWSCLTPDWPIWNMILNCKDQYPQYDFTPEFFVNTPMPKERLLFDLRTRALYNVNIFHHTSYLHHIWGRFFDILALLPGASGYQDVLILRKPA